MSTLFLFDLESLYKELIDVLRLFVAEIGAKILHEFDDAVLPEILVCLKFECVVGHVSYIIQINSKIAKRKY